MSDGKNQRVVCPKGTKVTVSARGNGEIEVIINCPPRGKDVDAGDKKPQNARNTGS